MACGDIIARSGDGGWLRFSNPVRVHCAMSVSELSGVLRAIDAETAAGMAVAGFISYEAAAGIDAAFCVHKSNGVPLIWFGVYPEPEFLSSLPQPSGVTKLGLGEPSVSAYDYAESIRRIKSYIADGDTYQVNYTIRIKYSFGGDAYALFCRLYHSQPTAYAAYIDIGEYAVCSVSPELFFELDGDCIRMRPMKGTARRGLSANDDSAMAEELRSSHKNCAENVMIVDMVRNDLGRIAERGSVDVKSLFDIERYPTVWQMTSTVEARTLSGFSDLMKALFPCASITGAPKVRTMEIIRELEHEPRGIYTGSIGYWLPGRQARFNVAIRTAVVDRESQSMIYGVGGGIVWDSVDEHELDECLAKAAVLESKTTDFELLETMLWTPQDEFVLLERHLERIEKSATYFGYEFKRTDMVEQLAAAVGGATPLRVRLLLARYGELRVEAYPLLPETSSALSKRVVLLKNAVQSNDLFLYHKTTHRTVYEVAQSRCADYDDVLLMNERGEVTESTIANLVAEIDGVAYTPPVSCGLLPGTMRAELLERGELQERVITPEDLRKADAVWLINSVRGRIEVQLPKFSGMMHESAPRRCADTVCANLSPSCGAS